ncbi:S8 family serine peptidase [Niastella caeni]|uniref:S8 family serine peptidase n=1 Tax=Niastella caeni TaxID=2569763 RepID=UPI001AA0ABFF|nr:S8 family serine peptidase [Niastella caeni]
MRKEKHQMPVGNMSQEDAGTGKMPGEAIEKQSTQSTGGMIASSMDTNSPSGGGEGAVANSMPMMEMAAAGSNGESEMRNVIVEIRVPSAKTASFGLQMGAGLTAYGFQLDYNYEPVPVGSSPNAQSGLTESEEGQVVLVRGTVPAGRITELEQQPNVIKVWNDTRIEHFEYEADILVEEEQKVKITPMEGLGTCPIGTCDCAPGTPKGTIADVANYLGVNQIWASGFKGDGIVVGVVDGGITAQGRSISTDDTNNPSWPNKLIPRVIGGYPTANWGTTGAGWGWHGNMCSTDVLGMAPNAQIYDIRIAAPNIPATISNAIAGFQWAIDQHKANGTPQILTNSWGIFQDNWDPVYATDPNHPFTRKVVDALNEGIIVLFAAGNCGGSCPDGRCGTDNGPGKSIWGANGHPRVMTVGAVNKNEQFVGYSSQGPAALDPQKPDFCSITHFTGFFTSDSGTSAATPVAAGCIALLKQAKPSLTQDQVKTVLKNTAKDIGPAGFDQHSGAGIIRPKQALESIAAAPSASGPVVSWGPNRLDVFVIGTDSALYHKWWNGSAWGPSLTGYENMGGTIISAPEVVSWGPNRLDVFVVGANSALYHKWWNGASWGPSLTGYENMGGIIQGQPKVVSWGPNRLDVFVVGTDRSLYHKWWNGSAWGPSLTGYENLGGKIIGNPEVVCWGPNRIDIFVVGTDSSLYHKWWNGSAWGPSLTGWENLGGTILGQPKAVSWGPNRLDVFVVGTNSALYHKWWNGSAWGPSITGYENMGGTIIGSPEAVSWGPNRLDVFVTGTNSALYHKWWNGSAWGPSLTGYENMGGTIIGQPRVASWGSNRLDVFVVGTNSALFHKWWNGASWGPSLTGYENMGGIITRF